MEHCPNSFIQSSRNGDLNRANQWDIGKAHLPTGRSWKGGIQIDGAGEKD
jgi:hypothetical protein